ncbi:hypothetical protein FRC12_003822 [Ceratobasidium sp. 428]|nr:hypothetical protein FRC12_003822 [Ceratobasidium sp. 428]
MPLGVPSNQAITSCKRRGAFIHHSRINHQYEPTEEDVKIAKKAHEDDYLALVDQGSAAPVPQNTRRTQAQASRSHNKGPGPSEPLFSRTPQHAQNKNQSTETTSSDQSTPNGYYSHAVDNSSDHDVIASKGSDLSANPEVTGGQHSPAVSSSQNRSGSLDDKASQMLMNSVNNPFGSPVAETEADSDTQSIFTGSPRLAPTTSEGGHRMSPPPALILAPRPVHINEFVSVSNKQELGPRPWDI